MIVSNKVICSANTRPILVHRFEQKKNTFSRIQGEKYPFSTETADFKVQ